MIAVEVYGADKTVFLNALHQAEVELNVSLESSCLFVFVPAEIIQDQELMRIYICVKYPPEDAHLMGNIIKILKSVFLRIEINTLVQVIKLVGTEASISFRTADFSAELEKPPDRVAV